MHTAKTAIETLELLWNNYQVLCEKVDLDCMPPELLESRTDFPIRPFRIAAWLARQGFFIAAWSLWEYYACALCGQMANKVDKKHNESTVNWVARSLAANDSTFNDQSWFEAANCLRNLIAHNGTRVDDQPRTQRQWARSRVAFPTIETWQDGYVELTHDHVAELIHKIEWFIRKNRIPNSST